jgi:hypothetical protein
MLRAVTENKLYVLEFLNLIFFQRIFSAWKWTDSGAHSKSTRDRNWQAIISTALIFLICSVSSSLLFFTSLSISWFDKSTHRVSVVFSLVGKCCSSNFSPPNSSGTTRPSQEWIGRLSSFDERAIGVLFLINQHRNAGDVDATRVSLQIAMARILAEFEEAA